MRFIEFKFIEKEDKDGAKEGQLGKDGGGGAVGDGPGEFPKFFRICWLGAHMDFRREILVKQLPAKKCRGSSNSRYGIEFQKIELVKER